MGLTQHSRSATRFDVPVDFLSQQVAFLTERHASQVRAQVRKATAAAKGSAPSPILGSELATSAHQRTGSALSTRRDVPISRQDVNTSSTPATFPVRPSISRHASVNRHPTSFPNRALDQGARKRLSSLPITSPTAKSPDPQVAPRRDKTTSPGPAESSSNESSDDESSPAQSRIIRRPPRFQQQDVAETYQDDGDDESEPAFQSHQGPSDQTGQDMASTLKGDERAAGRQSHKGSMGDVMHQSQTSDDSSTGSPFAVQKSKPREPKGLGPLSPRRTAELAGRSPSGKGKASPREDSEGTPSMGSSFSDLDGSSSLFIRFGVAALLTNSTQTHP